MFDFPRFPLLFRRYFEQFGAVTAMASRPDRQQHNAAPLITVGGRYQIQTLAHVGRCCHRLGRVPLPEEEAPRGYRLGG